MADQAKGGLGNYPTARCLPGGMPRMMAAPRQEYVITPDTDSEAAMGTNQMDPATRIPAAQAGFAQGKREASRLTFP